MAKKKLSTPQPAPQPPEKTPKDEKPKRPRIAFDTDPILKRAIELRSFKMEGKRLRKVPQYEVIAEILRSALAEEIEQATRELGSSG